MGKELELAIKIGGKVDKSLGAAINNAQSQLNKIAKVGNMVGAGITTAVVTAGASLIAESTKQAISYEKAMAGVAKVVDDCRDANGNLTETYHELYNGILDMSTEIPMTANDISSIVESAGQAGIAKDELLDFAESAAKMGIAFDTTAEQAGDWMAQWRTSMGLTQTEVETLADQINYLGNTSSEKATKLSEVVSRVGALGKIAGLSGGQVAAIAAAMPGVEAEVAATGIKNMTKAMTKGEAVTEKQQAVLDKLGFSATELANRMQTDAQGAILDLLGSIKQLPEAEQSAALSQYFGNESVSAIAPLLSNLDNLQEQFGKVGDSSKYAGSMQTEYDAAAATTANKIELLKNKISKEMIDLGNQIMPVLSESIDKISDKIPELADIIGRAIEKIIPIATSAFEFLVDNSDKIVSGAIGIAKAFIGFKIAGGAIKGINNTVDLIKDLSKITAKTGITKTLTGVIGSLTGISTAGGTVSGTLIGLAGSFASAVAPATLAAAAIFGIAAAVNAVHKHKLNYASGMNEAADGIEKASNALVKYNDIAAEIPTLRKIISDENSSTADVETAKARLQEIADLLSEEYNLTINADTSSLENAVNMAQQLSRTELIDSSNKLINKATKNADKYKSDMSAMPGLQVEQKILQDQQVLYKSLQAEASQYRTAFDNGQSSYEQYMSNMNALYDRAKESSLVDAKMLGDTLNAYNTQGFLEQLGNGFLRTDEALTKVNGKIETANKNITEFDESTQKAGEYLTQALASDVKNNNAYGADTDISMIENLGKAMVAAGKNTDELSTKFAKAKSGYTDFAEAIAAGKAPEMAQSFIEYKTAIGETSEAAVQGAALIANGFENVTQATAAGDEAINNVIANMKSLGDMKGIFDGLDSGGVADKLSDMAHAMNLIPENKSITIDANGNFQVIQEAENQIASLKSQGNVDVSVNANGDLSIFNEATNKMGTLQGMGAATLQVNADGNIDVLNKAQEVIATIDSKSAQISINGQAYGLDQIEQAKNAAAGLDNKSATVTATATDNASPTIEGVQNNLTALNGTTANPTITANDQASGTISSVASQLSSLDGQTATTTIITKYETQGTPPGKSAKGTPNWRGGLTYVNDQNISDPREVIEHNGMRYYYEGRNVLADVPHGARIYTAAESRQFIDGSHKNGLERVPFDGYIAELHKGERVLTSTEAGKYNNTFTNSSMGLDELEKALFGVRTFPAEFQSDQMLTADDAGDYDGGTFGAMLEWLKEMIDDMRGGKDNRGGGGGSGNDRPIVFSPTYNVYGDADRQEIREAGKMSFRDFKEMYEELKRDEERKKF